MKKILILVIAITFSLLAQSQKVSPNTYIISFIDKDTTTFKISEPEKFLSERAINRRQKYNIPVTEQDLPVNINYVNKIKDLGFKIYETSKWLNHVVVYSEDSTLIEKAEQLSFVKKYSKNKINSFGTYDTENISISTTNVCNIVSELPTFITKKKIKLGITENQFNIIMKNCPFIKKKKIKGVLYVIDFYDKLFNMKYEIEKNADTLFSDIYLYYGRYFFNGEKKLTEFSFGLHYP